MFWEGIEKLQGEPQDDDHMTVKGTHLGISLWIWNLTPRGNPEGQTNPQRGRSSIEIIKHEISVGGDMSGYVTSVGRVTVEGTVGGHGESQQSRFRPIRTWTTVGFDGTFTRGRIEGDMVMDDARRPSIELIDTNQVDRFESAVRVSTVSSECKSSAYRLL